MQRIKFFEDNNKKEIVVPATKNWFFIIIFLPVILIWLAVEVFVVPILTIANLDHILSFVPWIVGWTAIGLFIIKIWAWEAFGKTILLIREDELLIKKKFDFISSTKYFKLMDITYLMVLDKEVETTKYFTRKNYLFSSNTKSVVFNYGFLRVNAVEWINQDEAQQIIDVLSKSIESSKYEEN